MELAIPLIALGGMYIVANQEPTLSKNKSQSQSQPLLNVNTTKPHESFTNMGRKANDLPNVNNIPQNYPIIDNKELIDTVEEYPNPNSATDKYFNQNLYKQNERSGMDVGNNMQQIYSLTGNYLDSNEFKHNNMVPFNGKKPHGQIYNVNNAENYLDNMVGSGTQHVKKIEQAPLFKPQENVQWAYGAPNMSEFYQSRVNPATKNNMVKPFQSEKVGPGLNKGFDSAGSGGFNSGLESRDKWMPKSVDELRVSTNPKEEYSLLNHEGPSNASIKNVGLLGKVEKNRPDTYFINSQDRWLTTTGAEKAQRMVAKEVFHTSNRNETTTAITGTPNASIKTASYTPNNYEAPKRIELESCDVPHSSAVGRAPHIGSENHLKSHTNIVNNRSINQQPQTFGSGFRTAIGAVIAPIMDILTPTHKEEYTSNMRIYGNMSGNVSSNYVQTQGDIPGVTIKETTLYQPNSYIGNQIDRGGYQTAQQQPIANQRDTSNISQYNAPSSKYGERVNDAVYRQTNNEKLGTVVANSGRTNSGNMNLLNHNMNIHTSKNDNPTNWVPAPNSVINTGPSVKTYGSINMPQYHEDVNAKRLTPDILTAFKENPYTHSLSSY